MHDDEGRLVGDGDLAGLERVEVDVERVPGGGAGDGQRVEQADVGAGAALGLLAVAGQRERVEVVAEGEQERDREGGARRQAGADRQRARHPDRPTARWRSQPQESGRQGGLGGNRGGVTQHDLDGLPGELVRVDADQEAAGLRREGDLGGQVDGHRQREAAVVVGVVADDGDSSGGAGGGHAPSLAQDGLA